MIPPTVTAEQLGNRCGVKDEDERTRLLALATKELETALAKPFREMPVEDVDECIYRIGRALKDSGKTSTGASQLQIDGGATIPRAPTDPLASSRKIIQRYTVPF